MKYSDKQIGSLIEGIFNGDITEYNLPVDLYTAIAEYLKAGLYKGFGATIANVIERDAELLANLRDNVYMFSAAKTYQEVKDINSLLVDSEGNVRSQREFNAVARETYNNWNQNWGETEYNTAILQAGNSVKWAEIEANKEIMSRLTYSTIGDACSVCAPLDGFTAEVDDEIWDTIYPENHFNCMCVVEQTDEETPLTEDRSNVDESVSRMSDTFKNNAGKSGMIFPKEHPYFDVAKEDRDYARNNFDLPIPETDGE